MASPEVIEPIIQKEDGDCGLAAVAMLCCKPYREVSEIALKIFKTRPHSEGLDLRQLKTLIRKLGENPISVAPKDVDITEETGIVSIAKKNPHYAILFQGSIIDPANGLIYTVDAYCAEHKARITRLIKIS